MPWVDLYCVIVALPGDTFFIPQTANVAFVLQLAIHKKLRAVIGNATLTEHVDFNLCTGEFLDASI